MNRVIKFRAWHEEKMWFVKVFDWFTNSGCTKNLPSWVTLERERKDDTGEYVDTIEQALSGEKVELMQFVGLLDKNGKEIYEGDIMKTPLGNLEVAFITNLLWDGAGSEHSGFYFKGHEDMEFHLHLNAGEVVGNVFENPELLEEK